MEQGRAVSPLPFLNSQCTESMSRVNGCCFTPLSFGIACYPVAHTRALARLPDVGPFKLHDGAEVDPLLPCGYLYVDCLAPSLWL